VSAALNAGSDSDVMSLAVATSAVGTNDKCGETLSGAGPPSLRARALVAEDITMTTSTEREVFIGGSIQNQKLLCAWTCPDRRQVHGWWWTSACACGDRGDERFLMDSIVVPVQGMEGGAIQMWGDV
jgi:hypothetical protein